jgi:ribokinase
MSGGVAVVGSANLDIVVHTPVRPAGGQTVLGSAVVEAPGGKGLNQALAAARSAPTSFVGDVGDDAAGATLLGALRAGGVDASHVRTVPGNSGRAYIVVTPDAENSIVVLPLANAGLADERVVAALDALEPHVVLTQCEVSAGVVAAAAQWCGRHGARFVLNLSPVRDVPASVLAGCDPVIVNVAEAQTVLGLAETDPDALALGLAARARSAVVTAGGRGSVVAEGGRATRVDATAVQAVDTTGAGDAFAGTVAARLASGADLADAARYAAAEAARVIQLGRTTR